jgi:cobalt-zinc-cadmium efflux system protein
VHRHDHPHRRRGGGNARRLALALVLAASILVVEVIGGVLANSLALLADAGHVLTDVAALGLSWFAAWIARRPPSGRRTYGYYRAEILAALANGATLAAIAVLIVVEAVQRLAAPPQVRGTLMMVVAALGLAVNLEMLWVLREGRDSNLNVRGAWLHVFTDALGSVQTVIAGALVLAFGWRWADPVASLLISLLVLYSAWQLLSEAVSVLMESVPGGVDLDQVHASITAVHGVVGLHDLHVWSISTSFVALSAHVQVEDCDPTEALRQVREVLAKRFGIHHATIQVEPSLPRYPLQPPGSGGGCS